MPNIPKENRVAIRICYNGYIHKGIALKAEDVDGRSAVHIFDLPKGYYEEHGTNQIDYVFGSHCIEPDSSGEHGWIASELIDLDRRAGASTNTD